MRDWRWAVREIDFVVGVEPGASTAMMLVAVRICSQLGVAIVNGMSLAS